MAILQTLHSGEVGSATVLQPHYQKMAIVIAKRARVMAMGIFYKKRCGEDRGLIETILRPSRDYDALRAIGDFIQDMDEIM